MTGGDHSTGFIGPPYLRSGEITPDDLILHNTDNNIAPYYMLTQCHWTTSHSIGDIRVSLPQFELCREVGG